jgi:hypothetical protein
LTAEDIVIYRMVMPDLTALAARRSTPTRSRIRLRASGHRSLAFRVSHQRPAAWSPPAKDDDDDQRPAESGKRGKRR